MIDIPTVERMGVLKVYYGKRGRDGISVEIRERGPTRRRPLDSRLDLFNRSPTGFEWGYGGSGPAQLALAILADHLGDDQKTVRLHQDFNWSVVAKLNCDGRLSSGDIERWLERLPANRSSPTSRSLVVEESALWQPPLAVLSTNGNNSDEE